MTIDARLEQHLINIAKRPQRKFEETLTSFNRDIFWYSHGVEPGHQQINPKINYETHRKMIETAVTVLKADTPHDIALKLLMHRFFSEYRKSVFIQSGTFTEDFSYMLKKVDLIFNVSTGMIRRVNIQEKLAEYKTPTLVQINHATGTVSKVTVPNMNFTLNEWAIKFNNVANETTSYHIAGLTIGA